MSRLSNLLRQVETLNEQLAADLTREVAALSGRRAFGLNFERHIPETVELPKRPVRKGDKVRFLPERGAKPDSIDRRLWRVSRLRRTDDGLVADLFQLHLPENEHETATRAVDDLVVAAEFLDPIYPGLVSTGKLARGGDRPFHTVINAENFGDYIRSSPTARHSGRSVRRIFTGRITALGECAEAHVAPRPVHRPPPDPVFRDGLELARFVDSES